MASYQPVIKNGASGAVFYLSLRAFEGGGWQANPTLAAGDVKIAIDDGAPANLGTLPAVDADFTDRVKVVLSQAETNGDNLTLIFKDQTSPPEWTPVTVNIQTVAANFDSLNTKIDTIDDFLDTEVAAILAAVDTEVAAIKAKTDSLTFTVAGVLDAAVTHWRATAVATPTVEGLPEVDVTHVGGTAVGNRIARWALGFATGAADSGSTTTVVDAERTEADVDYFKDAWIIFTSGTIVGQARRITAFDPATDTITFAPATTQAVSTNNYIIAPQGYVAIGQLDEDSATLDIDAAVRAALGLAGANLDTQIGDLPTNAELAAAIPSADITAIKAKTDDLTFGVANTVNVNVTYVNEVEVAGTGVVGDEWGPAP